MVTKFNDQWEIEDDFDSDSDLYSNLEVNECENDDDFESFFSSEEIEKLRDKFKEFARKANEFGKPTIIKTYLEMSHEYDSYLDTISRKNVSQIADKVVESLEDKALHFFQIELNNINLAINYAEESQQWKVVIDMSENLRRFLNTRTYWQELEEIQKKALDAAIKSENRLSQAYILNQLGEVDRLRGRATEGISKCEESKSIFQSLENKHGEAKALYTLGYLNRSLGEYEKSGRMFEEALKLFRSLVDVNVGVEEDIADSLDGLGQAYEKQGNLDQAETVLLECLQIKEKLDNRFKTSISLNNLGKVYTRKNCLEEAKAIFEKCLTIKKELGDSQGEATSLNELGKVHRLLGEYEKALNYYHDSLRVKEKVSNNKGGGQPDKHGQGLTYMEIGLLYEKKEDQEKTQNYFQLALDYLNDYSSEFKEIAKKIQRRDE
jgi:tetratricopeptide (TPR) repeat protein